MEIHKRKADCFYSEKRTARKHAEKFKEFEAITMDFGKNLHIPNIPQEKCRPTLKEN